VLGQKRRDFRLDLLDRLVGVVVGQGVKDVVDLGQKLAVRSRASMVLAKSGAAAPNDGLNLFLLPAMPSWKAGRKWAFFDLRERGRSKRSRHSVKNGFISAAAGFGSCFFAQENAPIIKTKARIQKKRLPLSHCLSPFHTRRVDICPKPSALGNMEPTES